jgi:hypothetical protein
VTPIPLTDPTGRVRSYACGNCGNISTPSYYLGGVDDETAEYAAEKARDDAERCCKCSGCGAKVRLWLGICDACAEKAKAAREAAPPSPPVELCRHHEYAGECDTCDEVEAAKSAAYEAAARECEEYARRLVGLNAWTDAVPAAATGCADAIRALAGKAAT